MATIKQRKAAELLVENGGNASKAMRDAGYSPATAKTPQKLTDSTGFQELCDGLANGSLFFQHHRAPFELRGFIWH